MPRLAGGGLTVPVPNAPAESLFAGEEITEEAVIGARRRDDFRVEPLVAEGDLVAQGAPVLRSRRHPEVVVTAPMAGRVAALDLGPGHRLSALKLFHEAGGGRHRFEVTGGTRGLLLSSGLWRLIRSRPFGRVPLPGEAPSAIFVQAQDTRPLAPDPRDAIHDCPEDFARGLDALLGLTDGPVFLCQDVGEPLAAASDRLRVIRSGGAHPWGLPGVHIHHHHPAQPGRPVWDIHAEDVAGIGALLATGHVPQTRLVAVAGPALKQARFVRCQPGADLRRLCYGYEKPGSHRILSGSAIDGTEARWLGLRDRQISVLDPSAGRRRAHWFLSALSGAARPAPLIPSAAVEQALGGVLPVMPFLRALTVGDAETFARLGGLSLVPEDLALADYVTQAEPRLTALMAGLLDRIAAEEGA